MLSIISDGIRSFTPVIIELSVLSEKQLVWFSLLRPEIKEGPIGHDALYCSLE